MLWLIASPRPVPCVFVVKKGMKRLRSTLGEMPGPVSRTLTSTCSTSSVSDRRDGGLVPRRGGRRNARAAVAAHLRRDRHLALTVDGLDGVLHQVHEHLAELLRV